MFNRIMYPLRINYRINILYYDILYFDVRITSILPYVLSYDVPTSYKLLIFSIYLVASIVWAVYRGLDNISVPKRSGLQLPRLLSVWFRIYAGFVKFYSSLMAHGYGSEKSRVVTARFNGGCVPRF